MKGVEFEILGFLVQQPVPLATVILSQISYMLPQPLRHPVQMLILKADQVVANSGIDPQVTTKITRFTNNLDEISPVLQVSVVASVALARKAFQSLCGILDNDRL